MNGSVSRSTLETGGTLTMPENRRFDLLTVQKMQSINRVSPAAPPCAPFMWRDGVLNGEGSRPHVAGNRAVRTEEPLPLCSCRDYGPS